MLLRLLESGQFANVLQAEALNLLKHQTSLAHEQAVLDCLQNWFNKNSVCFNTSGTTGAAKTFCFTHQQIQLSAQASIQAFGLSKQTRFLLCMQPQFVGAAMLVYRAALLGAELGVVGPSKNPLKDLPLAHGYNFVSLVPYQLNHILACPASTEKLKAFDTILIGGAAIDPALEQAIVKHQLNAYHSYGMTETLSHIALLKIGHEKAFKILPGVKIGLTNEHCLFIETPWNQTPITTKDCASILADGRFTIQGRLDFLINSGGIKMNPELLEQHIAQYLFSKGIQNRPFVIAWNQHAELGQALLLVTEHELFAQNVFEGICKALQISIHPYAFPKAQIALPAFPRTESGKIDRFKIIEQAQNQLKA